MAQIRITRHCIVNLLLLAVFSLNFQLPARALETEVVVTLFKAHQPLDRVFIKGPARILKPAAAPLQAGLYALFREGGRFKLMPQKQAASTPVYFATNEIELAPSSGKFRLGLKADALRAYRGRLSLAAEGVHLVLHNRVSMRDYVSSVVGSETLSQFPEEALKAQAVLIQTAMRRYKKNDELNDSTEKQCYLGADFERAAVLEAVRKTWGKTLSFEGRPLPVYFHACCAGGTSTSELFSQKHSGLACDAAVPCSYCRQSAFFQTTRHQIPAAVVSLRFPEGIPVVVSRDSSARPILLKYADSGLSESGYSFWLKVGQRLGWDKMPGTRFQILKSSSGDIELSSTGAGHGVGLCQWGAAGMAKQGINYEKILNYYFPGSKLVGD